MECACCGQEHLRTVGIAQAEQKSKQCLQHEQQILVVCGKDSSALCLKSWCVGFQHKGLLCHCSRSRDCRNRDGPHGHLLNHKTQIFLVLQCLQTLLLLLWYQQQDEFSLLPRGAPEVLCDAKGELLSRSCWRTVQYLLTLCHRHVGEKGP